MKKARFLVLGLIALMLVSGLVLASCGNYCPNDHKCAGGATTCGRDKCAVKVGDKVGPKCDC